MERLCKIRDIQRGIMLFEQQFTDRYGICLNEGMALCSICNSDNKRLTSGEIGELLGLTFSHTSKVIASIEKKGLVERTLGENDKRKMFFSLTNSGEKILSSIKCNEIEIPEILSKI